MNAVEVQSVGVTFRLDRGGQRSMKEAALRRRNGSGGGRPTDEFQALQDVSFTVGRGEVFGIVGPNGAGKSTLLRVLANVLPPTTGRVVVRGSVAPLIELGTGFDHELTATENILLNGAVLGRSVPGLRRRVGPILEWAGVEDFADVPVRNFSSGMVARLAFAIATDVRPDLLLVDELLAVGDLDFGTRSLERIERMVAQGTTMILVSHRPELVSSRAGHALWLDRGQARAVGPSAEVCSAYEAHVRDGRADRQRSSAAS